MVDNVGDDASDDIWGRDVVAATLMTSATAAMMDDVVIQAWKTSVFGDAGMMEGLDGVVVAVMELLLLLSLDWSATGLVLGVSETEGLVFSAYGD